ncbi:MAG: ABC transporter substrate-binding protein [Polyangiaceae bacterium]|nr:ABC transporter substrate-binding protein [Polyangiaceae bacterium]
MNRRQTLLGGAAMFALAACRGEAAPRRGDERVVVAGGPITEIAFAIGAGEAIVGADTSSVFPAETSALPKVGYQRQLASEGVLSLSPTMLLASDEAGPPEALDQIRGAGVRVVTIGSPKEASAIPTRVLAVGDALARAEEAQSLASKLEQSIAALERKAASRTTRPRVLLLYARGHGSMLVGGRRTAAEIVLSLAGCTNAASDLEGFVPLTPEAALAARPEIVLAPQMGLESLGGAEALFATPGLSETPAARNRRVVAVDDLLLLGLGPRIAEAVEAVASNVFA